MRYLLQLIHGSCPYPSGGRDVGLESGECLLELLETIEESVVNGIRYFRLIFYIIEVIVILNPLSQGLHFLPRLFLGQLFQIFE